MACSLLGLSVSRTVDGASNLPVPYLWLNGHLPEADGASASAGKQQGLLCDHDRQGLLRRMRRTSLTGTFVLTVENNLCEGVMPLERNLTLPVDVELERC